MRKADITKSAEERATDALNEQGFLFSQRIRHFIETTGQERGLNKSWAYVEKEYPVTASDGAQTRIDIVLRNVTRRGIHICLECKRAHPDYKSWIFFDEDYRSSGLHKTYFLETIRMYRDQIGANSQVIHRIQPLPERIEQSIFTSYLEVAIKPDRRSSYTQTIEDALLQVMRGHSGLIAKMLNFDKETFFASIPVIVTTAELFEARFSSSAVDLKNGKLQASELGLNPLQFCAVTYHPNDNLAIEAKGISSDRTSIEEDIVNFLKRTVSIGVHLWFLFSRRLFWMRFQSAFARLRPTFGAARLHGAFGVASKCGMRDSLPDLSNFPFQKKDMHPVYTPCLWHECDVLN